jgi:hypothetical protein
MAVWRVEVPNKLVILVNSGAKKPVNTGQQQVIAWLSVWTYKMQ